LTAPSAPQAGPQPAPSRASIATSAILAGVCALSPIPFLDDLIIGAIRRHLVGRQFRARGVELNWGQRRALTKTHRNLLVGCLLGVLIYPIRKIFRKVFYIFAVKEAVDVASRLLHQGLLVDHALDRGCVDIRALGPDKAPLLHLNRVITDTCDDTDTSPISQTIKRSFRGGRVFLRRFGRQVVSILRGLGVLRRGDVVDTASGQLQGDQQGILDELRAALLGEEDYFEALRQRFDGRWERALRDDAAGDASPEDCPEEE
jgi:hypothetical protein